MTLKIEPSLIPLFQPKGIVIVGASSSPTKLGFGLARNLVQSGYRGALHFVNPKGGVLLERPLYPTIAEIPDPVDLAVLLIPAKFMPATLEQCGQCGIRVAIIASGGFREVGQYGAALEKECVQVAQSYEMRLIGPNCIGFLDTHLPMDTTFLPPPGATPGDIAFVSHSGAICAAVIDWARGQGFGLSQLLSLGNQADVTETDVLASVAADPNTKVISLYMEGVSNGRKFVDEAAKVVREKPVVALKVGRFASGQKAVASHTGALAGQESAFDAAFWRAGVIRADTSEALSDWARSLAWCPLPQGRNVAVLTNAGGPGVTAADALESLGLQMATFSEQTKAALRKVLPPAASISNPVDMLASASPTHYAECLQILLADPDVHSVMVIIPPPPMYSTGGVARAMIPTIYTTDKPVLAVLMGESLIQEAVTHFRAAKVPEYRFPERAAGAIRVLVQRTEYLQTELPVPEVVTAVSPQKVQEIIQTQPDGFMPQEPLNEILEAYGIPVPPVGLATSAEEAVTLAEQMGYPVAMKIASPDIPHKSDIGGVLLNREDAAEVTTGFAMIMDRAKTAHPEATLLGIDVQKMIPTGQEVIVGVVQDAQFGPLVMFGSGGVEVEGLQDVAFALAPMTRDEAERMLAETWAGRKLDGYRQLPKADKTAVIDVLFRLGQLAADFPQFAEIEINPLRVLPDGDGVFAVDARARVKN
ncbi:MAG: CoA-binding protein [Chloroflexi bacterium]|nr:MAG: CoA-binding protein [Chloroflexota bacterium]